MDNKDYLNIFDEPTIVGECPWKTPSEFLKLCAEKNNDALKLFKEGTARLFEIWDTKNVAAMKKGSYQIVPKVGERFSEYPIMLPCENLAYFFPYLYRGTNDIDLKYVCRQYTGEESARIKLLIETLADAVAEELSIFVDKKDVELFVRRKIRLRYSDWKSGVAWNHPVDYVLQIELEEVKADFVETCRALIPYWKRDETATEEELLKIAKSSGKIMCDRYLAAAFQKWNDYAKVFKEKTAIKDRETFMWVVDKTIKLKTNYFLNCYKVKTFFENLDGLFDVSIKGIVYYIDKLLEACNTCIKVKNLVNEEPDPRDKYYENFINPEQSPLVYKLKDKTNL